MLDNTIGDFIILSGSYYNVIIILFFCWLMQEKNNSIYFAHICCFINKNVLLYKLRNINFLIKILTKIKKRIIIYYINIVTAKKPC